MAEYASRISGRAKIAGVIGWPVAHSLSPRLHNYWLSHYIIDGAYIPLAVKPEDLADTVKALPKMGFRGFNVTVPHKESVMKWLDSIDDEARAIGAVNTVTVDNEGRLRGGNSDAYGFMKNIGPHLGTAKNKAVVFGSGGAAKAICYGLLKSGFAQVAVTNRTRDKADTLAAQLPGVTVEAWENRSNILEGADLAVNATSLGMNDRDSLEVDLSALPLQAIVTDIVYTPLLTSFLRKAKARGNPVVDGLGMLLHQAVPGFKAWYGLNPEITRELRQYVGEERADDTGAFGH